VPAAPEHTTAQAGAARSPERRERPAASTSAWPPTTEPAKPCTSSPTTPATAPPGQPSCMPTPAPPASATPKRSESSGAPGSGSSGPAGTPTRPTTRPSIVPNNAIQPDHLTQKTQTAAVGRGLSLPARRCPIPGSPRVRPQPTAAPRPPGILVPVVLLGHGTMIVKEP
jgi:hypothetical protein